VTSAPLRHLLLGSLFALVCSGEGRADVLDVEQTWKFQGERHHLAFEAEDADWCMRKYGLLYHYWSDQGRYIQEDPCKDSMATVAQLLWNMAREKGYGTKTAVEYAISFVSSFPTEWDSSASDDHDLVRYSYQMFLDGRGDCEDHAILFAALMSHWCIDAILIETHNHVFVGVNPKSFPTPLKGHSYAFEGERYYVCEPSCYGCDEDGFIGEEKSGGKPILRVPALCTTFR